MADTWSIYPSYNQLAQKRSPLFYGMENGTVDCPQFYDAYIYINSELKCIELINYPQYTHLLNTDLFENNHLITLPGYIRHEDILGILNSDNYMELIDILDCDRKELTGDQLSEIEYLIKVIEEEAICYEWQGVPIALDMFISASPVDSNDQIVDDDEAERFILTPWGDFVLTLDEDLEKFKSDFRGYADICCVIDIEDIDNRIDELHSFLLENSKNM